MTPDDVGSVIRRVKMQVTISYQGPLASRFLGVVN